MGLEMRMETLNRSLDRRESSLSRDKTQVPAVPGFNALDRDAIVIQSLISLQVSNDDRAFARSFTHVAFCSFNSCGLYSILAFHYVLSSALDIAKYVQRISSLLLCGWVGPHLVSPTKD
jgi:hypothetical protein